MKISKAILRNMAITLSVGASLAACTKAESPTPEKGVKTNQSVSPTGRTVPSTNGVPDPCPACGMG